MPLTEDEIRNASSRDVLEKAIEEAAELIHAIQKFKLHGPVGIAPDGTKYDNLKAMLCEAIQVGDLMRIWGAHHFGMNYATLKDEIQTLAVQELEEGRRPYFGSVDEHTVGSE